MSGVGFAIPAQDIALDVVGVKRINRHMNSPRMVGSSTLTLCRGHQHASVLADSASADDVDDGHFRVSGKRVYRQIVCNDKLDEVTRILFHW